MNTDMDVLLEFNKVLSVQASIVSKTNFLGDLDNCEEWLFYKLSDASSKRIGGTRVLLLGSYREGEFFKSRGEDGFLLSSCPYEMTLLPVSEYGFVTTLIWQYRQTSYPAAKYKSSIKCPRYWEADEQKIEHLYPKSWKIIHFLCSKHIEKLNQIGKAKDYKSGWVWHQYKKLDLDKIINDEFLAKTEFYYSSEIFYNKFSSDFSYISSKEKQEIEYDLLYRWSL